MKPFLENIASKFWNHSGASINNYIFVFPNRRSGVFFNNYLYSIADKPFFTPQITTISDLITSLSELQKIDRITLLFTLYDAFIKISQSTESFDEFYYWGEMLLNDFDDIDKYLIDEKQLFKNISDIKEIEDDYTYLTPEQMDIIKRFWVNFYPMSEEDESKRNFYKIWEILAEVYALFKKTLRNKGLAYEGMIFRDVVENLESYNVSEKFPKQFVFIGLNAHSKSEDKFLSFLQKIGKADFYWDYNSPMVADKNNKSSHFIDYNKFKYKSHLEITENFTSENNINIKTIGIPSAVGQTKFVHSILSELENTKQLTKEDLIKTAIVLPDENLLLPTLYSIPKSIDKINVTMGYKLTNSPIVSLMNNIFELQSNASKNGLFYFRNIINLLSHKYIKEIVPEASKSLHEYIVKHNRVRVEREELKTHPFFQLIFQSFQNWKEFSTYLKNILNHIHLHYYHPSNDGSEDETQNANTTIDIESEFNVEYYKVVCQLEDILSTIEYDIDVQTYIKFLKKTIQSISVPFEGEPLAGLQVMGVLETRALDFDNLIILSMNEGIFPMKRTPNSFIPYSLRKGFELPTYEHQDSIYAYHFYRLISRAKNIYLLYDSRTDSSLSGEISRYYSQIKHIYAENFNLSENLVVYEIATSSLQNIEIEKTEKIQEQLSSFLENGERKLSASSLNMYIDCPLQFYFSVVENLNDENEIEETIEASMFGTIFHYVMEKIYERYLNKIVTADTLNSIINDDKYLDELLLESFIVNFYKNKTIRSLSGQNFLVGEIIKKYVKKVLSEDAKLLKFKFLDSEEKLDQVYTTDKNLKVNIKGFIDRIDQVGNKIRIIDYKTGKGFLNFNSINDLFDKEKTKRPKAVMQVFLYSHLYMNIHPNTIIEPNIYYLRNLYNYGNFETAVFQRINKTKTIVDNFENYRAEFKQGLDDCINEIFDTSIPFKQTTTGEACKWCSFTNICKK